MAVTAAPAQGDPPQLADPELQVRTVVSGLIIPTTMAFLGPNDFFVLEKGTGKVQRVVNGAIQSTVLDLPANSASERGLLGIALHPDFPANPGVFLFWTESSTGADSDQLPDVELLGNRVDRFSEYRAIETSPTFFGLQQIRWSPENIATTREEVLARLFMVYEDGDEFGADLTGAEEVPPVTTSARAVARIRLQSDGTLRYELAATGPIAQATAAHIHLGAMRQNGPVVVTLFQSATPRDFAPGDMIAQGTITNASITARRGAAIESPGGESRSALGQARSRSSFS